MKTIFCDIDGVILHQPSSFLCTIKGDINPALGYSPEKLLEWHCKGYKVILVTGRTEAMRSITEKNLQDEGIIYDQLIMDAGSGPRYLINDIDPKKPNVCKANAIDVLRNQGLNDISI